MGVFRVIRSCFMSAMVFASAATFAADPLLDDPIKYSDDAGAAAAKQAKQRQEANRVFKPAGIPTASVRAMEGVDPAKIALRYNQTLASMKPAPTELYILVSETMPKAALVKAANQAQQAGGVVVFRGVKGGLSEGAFKRFYETIRPMVEKGAQVQIDPNIFNRFSATVVPMVVVSTSLEGCNQIQACEYNADMVAGDVTLDYALEYLAKKDSPMASSAAAFLARLQVDRKN